MSTPRIGLHLDPLDTLFFRDGRPFGAATKASGGLPTPQPLAGALRTALLAQHGFDFRRFSQLRRQPKPGAIRDHLDGCGAPQHVIATSFRGPWLALADKERIEPLLPVPANVVRQSTKNGKEEKGSWHLNRLHGSELPGWAPDSLHGLRPLWRKDEAPDAKHPGGFLTLTGIKHYLRGEALNDDFWLKDSDLYDFDNRTGIEIDPSSLTGIKGQIYGIRLLTLKPHFKGKEVCLYAEMLPPAAGELSVPELVPLGGEGRYVAVRKREAVCWPDHGSDSRSLWLLATPAFFPGKSPLPDVKPGKLLAAASGHPVAVSGWDIARNGPRPTRFAVPAGSVYFVDGPFNPAHQSLCADSEDVAQGWGYALRGSWNHA